MATCVLQLRGEPSDLKASVRKKVGMVPSDHRMHLFFFFSYQSIPLGVLSFLFFSGLSSLTYSSPSDSFAVFQREPILDWHPSLDLGWHLTLTLASHRLAAVRPKKQVYRSTLFELQHRTIDSMRLLSFSFRPSFEGGVNHLIDENRLFC